MTSSGYLRFPNLHGDLLTFVAEDDVWLAPLQPGGAVPPDPRGQPGGAVPPARAWRLTSDAVKAAWPRFSPDGTQVAWVSWRDGNPEVYLTDTEGGAATRLTYWNDDRTSVSGWTPDGDVLAVSASGQPDTHYIWAYAVPASGDAAPRRLPFGPVIDLTMAADSTFLVTGRFNREYAWWKRYRGGTGGKLWTATAQDPLFTRILADLKGQFSSPMLIGDRVAFLSDHEGTGNVYSCRPDGTDLRRHTDHDGFYARNASSDGQRIVYHVAGDLWLLDGLDAEQPRKLDITLSSPATARAPRMISAADHLGDLDCDHSGQASAVEVRGTVHWLTHKDGPARALYVSTAGRGKLPVVLGGTGRVAYVTDESGQDAVTVVTVDGSAEPRTFAEGQLGGVTGLAAAPDGALLAAAVHDGTLYTIDVDSGAVTEVAAADDGQIDGLAWSPDSEWLAWSQPGPQPLRRIRVTRIGTGDEVIDVTDGRFADTDPVFTLDGLHLAFLSRRGFDPVYDTHSFDMSFPYGARPYLVPLDAQTPSPFGPLPGGRPMSTEDKSDDPERPVVSLTADSIQSRVVPVPVPEARYASLRAVKGGLAWLREPLSGVLGESNAEPETPNQRPVLERFDLTRRECTDLVGELDWFAVSGDGTRIVVKDKSELRVIGTESKSDSPDDTVTVDLTRARFRAEPAALWRHAFEEAGRVMRRDYWVPDMSGVDWGAVLDAYRPLLDRVRGPEDFSDLLWEIFGELGTSHAYAYGNGAGSDDGSSAVGLLGADLSRDASGRWVVDRVLPGESSDPRARSPLAAPGVAIHPGDAIVAVDGQPVDVRLGPWPLLAGAAGKPAELTIVPAFGEQARRVAVVPLKSERRLRYQDWVAGRRQLVRELSEGRLGYLHIPDMMGEGWAHFSRDMRAEMRHDGLIMDVRGNSGGHISELVVSRLTPRVMAWDVARWFRPQSYPQDARRGPLVTLADENAGSDGDIVTAAIRALGLGPVVGTRTWGGVIGFNDYHELVDGTRMTVPQLAFAFDDYGWDVENYGVDPDVEVLITPDDWAAGRDPQLETAVRLALEALDKQGPATPPDPETGPRKSRPPLPPR